MQESKTKSVTNLHHMKE